MEKESLVKELDEYAQRMKQKGLSDIELAYLVMGYRQGLEMATLLITKTRPYLPMHPFESPR